MPSNRITRKPDQRFTLHGVQPRGKYLNRQQRRLCRQDPAFMQELRKRVSSEARWEAFIDGNAWFGGNPCQRCESTRRRVYNGSCYDCLLRVNKDDFQSIQNRVHPPANRSRAGWLDLQSRKRRERSGEVQMYEIGGYRALQFPTGRVRLIAEHLHIDTDDLKSSISSERLYAMALHDPAFLELLQRLGWAGSSKPTSTEGAPIMSRSITGMSITADSSVLAGAALSGTVSVKVTKRNGECYRVALSSIDGEDRSELLEHYWSEVPVAIRVLDDTPSAALQKYVAGKRRGYLVG